MATKVAGGSPNGKSPQISDSKARTATHFCRGGKILTTRPTARVPDLRRQTKTGDLCFWVKALNAVGKAASPGPPASIRGWSAERRMGLGAGQAIGERNEQVLSLTQTYFFLSLFFQPLASILCRSMLIQGLRWNQKGCRGSGQSSQRRCQKNLLLSSSDRGSKLLLK